MNPFFNEFMKYNEDDFLMVENHFDKKAILKEGFEESLTFNNTSKNIYENLDEYGMADYNNMLIEHLKRENEKLQMKLIGRGLDIGYIGYQFDRLNAQGGLDKTVQVSSKKFANRIQGEIEVIVLNAHKYLKRVGKRIKVKEIENKAYKERNADQSSFFYSFTNHEKFLGETEWNDDEISLFRNEIKAYSPENKIDWGYFSLMFRRKTGKQCRLKCKQLFNRKKKRKFVVKDKTNKKRRFK